MSIKPIPIWKEAPFLRLVVPFIGGIIAQQYLQASIYFSLCIFAISILSLIAFNLIKGFAQFKLYWLNGLFLNTSLFVIGMMLVYFQDISHNKNWINNSYKNGDTVIVTLQEPLVEKQKSFKALANVKYIINGKAKPVKGSILLYFKKDSSLSSLTYGSQIIFNKALEPIRNSGNPGSFDYERYCAFRGIYHQIFLKPNEFVVLTGKNENPLKGFLFATREKTLHVFQTYLPHEKERGLAEALMIGYKDDLDKKLQESFTNTGVVHIIAISGLHLALVYAMLVFMLKPFSKSRYFRIASPIILILSIWLYSLLSGASPSVMRATVMLSFIIFGESFRKKTSIYNSLSASAFLLLCYNPFLLWEVGFQLSYLAVLSIVIFRKPIYDLIYIKNKSLDFIWQLAALSLSAQILTSPISIFHFHQFPNYFLITNIVAVPLASIALFGSLLLCLVSFIPILAMLIGFVLQKIIWLLNSFIEHMETMPGGLWNFLQINIVQTILIYACITAFSIWLLKKNKNSFLIGATFLLGFIGLRTFSFWQSYQQHKMIVYNMPQHQAIDFMDGRSYYFKGDSILLEDGFLQNFHLNPSRVMHRVSEQAKPNPFSLGKNLFEFGPKRIFLIDGNISVMEPAKKIKVDVIVISRNPSLKISHLANAFDCPQWVFDASSSAWKIKKWQEECEQLGLSCHSVVDKGAFVLNLD
jgi:competence protein ComEC